MTNEVTDLLDKTGVAYELYEHAPVSTMEECAALDCCKGAAHAKNLFLCNRQGTRFYLLLIPADKAFKTSEFSKAMDVSRLSFGNEAQLLERLGITPGAVGPFALIHDSERSVQLVIDEDLRGCARVAFHPNTNAASVILSMDALLKCMKALGITARFVKLGGEAMA